MPQHIRVHCHQPPHLPHLPHLSTCQSFGEHMACVSACACRYVLATDKRLLRLKPFAHSAPVWFRIPYAHVILVSHPVCTWAAWKRDITQPKVQAAKVQHTEEALLLVGHAPVGKQGQGCWLRVSRPATLSLP